MRLVRMGLCLVLSGLVVSAQAAEVRSLTFRYRGHGHPTISLFLSREKRVHVLMDPDYTGVVMAVKKGGETVRANPLPQRRRHLFFYVNYAPIEEGIDTRKLHHGDRVLVRRERFDPSKVGN